MEKTIITGKEGLTAANLKTPAAIAQWETIGTYMRPPPALPTYNDPVQGACNSCYLVAALSSVAWVYPAKIATTRAAIGFYASQGVKTPVSITDALPTDSSHQLIYGRCSDSGESWPALYEKAYAKWKGCCAATEDKPVYAKLPWSNPVIALKEILGYYTNYLQKDTSAYNPADIPCDAGNKTTKPCVAWTKSTVDQAGLYPSHSYSILGKFGADYLVLRNPYGATIAEPTANVGSGTWQGINFGAADGVFALKIDAFKRNFAYYGHVSP